MGHQHHWRDEPPEGRLYFNKSFDERYGDEEDMATNSMLASPEELQRLRCILAKDPNFQNSSSWPKLTEWCSSCTKTRVVKVVLPTEEEKVLEEEKILDIVTAVKGGKPRGGGYQEGELHKQRCLHSNTDPEAKEKGRPWKQEEEDASLPVDAD